MVLVVADSVLNQENKLLCCITANQYRGNLFVDGFAQWFGSTLFLLIHLPDQKIHGGFGNDINLLTNGCDWKDCFAGNWGIVKANNLISGRKCSVFLEN